MLNNGIRSLGALGLGRDVILIDQLAHNCLQAGAQAGGQVHRFRHNDADEVERLLKEVRAESADRGIFLVLESLYSMDADSPDLPRILKLARKYEAIIILDVAHDFGAMSEKGFHVGGGPSPIVPVFVGEETLARFTSGHLTEQGLLANLVEFPAVARGKARFRFQVMPTHSAETAEAAAHIMAAAVQEARTQIANQSVNLNGKVSTAQRNIV